VEPITDDLVRTAADPLLDSVLAGITDGWPVTAAELTALAATIQNDPVQGAFAPAGQSPRETAEERVRVLRRVADPFARWWRGYFADQGGTSVPLVELWRLYIPFCQWLLRDKSRRRPDELYMVGFNGSPGAGKTVLSNAVAVVLNELLDPRIEGRAVARSGDDWYLGRREREPLRALGYDPGLPGVTNRGIPGTHDLDWLRRNLREMERSTPHSVIMMGNFDKKTDDQPTGADRYFEVRGKVGVFLFDLWFAGAETDVDPTRVAPGLRRAVAERLPDWRPVFDRMDALWAFDWPSFDQMLCDREAQERLVERRRGARGMSQERIRAFMTYMIERTWDWRTTSPVPPDRAITFHAWRDTNHRVIAVRRGGRAS
jgi:pantothenate kinase-related protein Tda10